jgi:hypothetical protein
MRMGEINERNIKMEEWKSIIGYEGLYEISNLGKVKSLIFRNGTTFKPKSQIMSSHDNGNGYEYISLAKNKKKKNFYIHRLVAAHFVLNKLNNNVVNHKDCNKKNNYFDNLEWVTTKENVLYSSYLMKKSKLKCKISNTGEKYIRFKYGTFKITIRLANKKYYKTFNNLQDAIFDRDLALERLYG